MQSSDPIVALSGIRGEANVERIKHGLTNESWLVSTHRERRVVRISNSEDDSLQIDRASEASILAAVGYAGIGPEVIVCDPSRRLLVTRYMGNTWSDADTHQARNTDRVAALLHKLHSLAPPPGVRRVDLLSVIDGYLKTLDDQAIVCEMTTNTFRTRAREMAVALYQDSTACLCHNDVHALNIVEGDHGALRLIDWEYAGVGEPLFDLASISIYHRYDQAERERLLSAYLPRAEGADWHRLEQACWLFDYIRDLWTAVREMPTSSLPSASPPLPRQP